MKTIKIDKATAERWLQSEVQELKDLALQTYPELGKKQLPKTWEELEYIRGYFVANDSIIGGCIKSTTTKESKNIFATKEQAEASIALAMLSQLREVYRDGWKPDWEDGNQEKYCIVFSEFLSFQSPEIRDLFLENFRELIKEAKPLML